MAEAGSISTTLYRHLRREDGDLAQPSTRRFGNASPLMRRGLMTSLALFALASCASKGAEKQASGEQAEAEGANLATTESAETGAGTKDETAAATAGLSPGPHPIIRSSQKTRIFTPKKGKPKTWKMLGGIELSNESLAQVYENRGSFFVALKATVKVGEENCMIQWTADLVEGTAGKGKLIATIFGSRPARAGETLTISGSVALAAKEAGRLGSALVSYWAICGDALPSPSAFDIEITRAAAEKKELGAEKKELGTEKKELGAPNPLHHSVFDIQRKPTKERKPTRCHFQVVSEDVNAAGYTLRRGVTNYSLGPAKTGQVTKAQVRVRRPAILGDGDFDFSTLAVSARSYINNVSCREKWDAGTVEIEGVVVKALEMHRYQSSTRPAVDDWTYFDVSATLSNTLGKDCAFRIRYQVLDKEGFTLHKRYPMTDMVHLPKATRNFSYRSDQHRLVVMKNQADDIGKLVVQYAKPNNKCTGYDPKRALRK